VEGAKQWWIQTFGCKQAKVPSDWDETLPSDVALTLPGEEEPAILLSDRSEVEARHLDRSDPKVPIIFTTKLSKAHDHLSARGVLAGPVQEDGETRFFEITDPEGKVLEICEEPQ
jgi:hypothetical protein